MNTIVSKLKQIATIEVEKNFKENSIGDLFFAPICKVVF